MGSFIRCIKVALFLAVLMSAAAACSGRLLSSAALTGKDGRPWLSLDALQSLGTNLATPRYLCIPKGASWMEKHEGRHRCAYNATSGNYRAVGVAYDLDQSPVADRKMELSTVLADYDKVYAGEECLNDIQITALLTISVKRGLDEAAECVRALDNFSCDVQVVLLDLIFAKGKDWLCEQEHFIAKLNKVDWTGATEALEETEWCKKNERRCEDDVAKLRSEFSTL